MKGFANSVNIYKALGGEVAIRLVRKYKSDKQPVKKIDINKELEKLTKLVDALHADIKVVTSNRERNMIQCNLGRVAHHAYVIFDSEKKNLDWETSEKDNKIKELYAKYNIE